MACIWDAHSGELLHILVGHKKNVNSAQYNDAGNYVVTASDDNTAIIWDASTGDLLHILKGHKSEVYSAKFNATGSQIVTTSWAIKRYIFNPYKSPFLWDALTGELLHILEGIQNVFTQLNTTLPAPK